MIYVCIDTNIYVKMLTDITDLTDEVVNYDEKLDFEKEDVFDVLERYQIKVSENTILEDLNTLIKNNAIKLIVPEIVILELKKINSKYLDNFIENYNKLMDSVSLTSDSLWNEVKDIKPKLLKFIEEEKELKIKYWKYIYKRLEMLFESKEVDIIYFTPEIMCQGQKRIICGEISESQLNDAYIIDSIYKYFSQLHLDENNEIILVTQNKKDFFINQKTLEFYELKEKFVNNKYKVSGLYSLEQLQKHINFKFNIVTPNNIQEKYDKLNAKSPQDFASENWTDEYSEKFVKIESENNKAINKIFEEKAVNAPLYLQDIRKRLLNEIMEILKKCRQTVSWNNRSELKLWQWLEERDEEQIPSSKLSELFIIKDNLKKYLQIHIENCENNYKDDDLF